MKYVVLARDLESEMIVNSFGVFKYKRNANRRLSEVASNDYEYCVEEVDPCGSFANDECEDKEE